MNHSATCQVYSRGRQVSSNSWSLGAPIDKTRYSVLGSLDADSENPEKLTITNPLMVFLDTKSPVDISIFNNDTGQETHVKSVMLYLNSFGGDVTVEISPASTDVLSSEVAFQCITIAEDFKKSI